MGVGVAIGDRVIAFSELGETSLKTHMANGADVVVIGDPSGCAGLNVKSCMSIPVAAAAMHTLQRAVVIELRQSKTIVSRVEFDTVVMSTEIPFGERYLTELIMTTLKPKVNNVNVDLVTPAETLKRSLSHSANATVYIEDGERVIRVNMSRTQMNNIFGDFCKKLEYTYNEIPVVLIGETRLPIFDHKASYTCLAKYAFSLTEPTLTERQDVSTLAESIGIETELGEMNFLAHRGTPLPVHRSLTASAKSIKLYAGDRKLCKYNRLLLEIQASKQYLGKMTVDINQEDAFVTYNGITTQITLETESESESDNFERKLNDTLELERLQSKGVLYKTLVELLTAIHLTDAKNTLDRFEKDQLNIAMNMAFNVLTYPDELSNMDTNTYVEMNRYLRDVFYILALYVPSESASSTPICRIP